MAYFVEGMLTLKQGESKVRRIPSLMSDDEFEALTRQRRHRHG